jgi:hypothetical protein
MRPFTVSTTLLCLAFLTLVGCPGQTADDLRMGRSSEAETKPDPAAVVPYNAIDVGNGVYYFTVVRADFARSLSGFIAAHPDLELVAMAGDGTSGHGLDQGYFVVFRQK